MCTGRGQRSWSGDDTSMGGKETNIVNVAAAHRDGKWSEETAILLKAGWYARTSSAPATVTVSLRDRATGQQRGAVQRTFQPGSQSSECNRSHRVGAGSPLLMP